MRSLVALTLLAVTACGSSHGGTAAPSPTTSPSTTASPTTSPTATAEPSEAASGTPASTPTASATPTRGTDLPDGRTYAYAKEIDPERRTVTVDVVQFLTGADAEKAAKEDGQEVENDYYVRNQSTKLRTLTFTAKVPVVLNTLTADETGSTTQDTQVSVDKLASYFDTGAAQQALFYLTLDHGVVTAIHEQYLP